MFVTDPLVPNSLFLSIFAQIWKECSQRFDRNFTFSFLTTSGSESKTTGKKKKYVAWRGQRKYANSWAHSAIANFAPACSGFESRHFLKIQNGRRKQKGWQYTLATMKNNTKKFSDVPVHKSQIRQFVMIHPQIKNPHFPWSPSLQLRKFARKKCF
jgi:hypothetical protein